VHVSLHRGVTAVSTRPVVDTGADHTVFDGTVALTAGWTEEDLIARAEDSHPIHGLAAGLPSLVGYRHRVTCLIPLGRRFAALELSVFFTPPNTLSTPVLGRRDFLQRVDFALVEAEQQFYLRFRDRTALRYSW
jgi:hypothetical protein